MGVSVLQPTFGGGEWSPSLNARVDLALYSTALALCSNFQILPFGGAQNRPGTMFMDSTKGDQEGRLVRFKFSNQDAYALEFTNLLMRVYRAGTLVLNTAGPNIGQPFELVTPYTLAQLKEMTFTQSADVMTFAQPDHKPYELKRFANDNWTMTPVSLVPSVLAPASATAVSGGGSGASQVWRYQVTAVLDDSNSIEESLPVTSNAITVLASVLQGTITWPAVVGATYYNIYKDNSGSGVYGFAGRSTTTSFTDNNITAIRTDTPPTGEDPFVGAGNFPGAVGYYQQRLMFGGTDLKPQTSWFSKVGIFHNFGYSIPTKDDDAITFTQASLEVERIQHYLPLKALLVLTSGAEWVLQGSDNGLTAKTIQAVPQSYNGCSRVPPIVMGNTALYVQARGGQVSSLSYTLEDDGFAGDDLTIFANHLFKNHTITEWAYQKVPNTIVWCIRSDGALLGLTYLRKQQVVAWHQHHTDGFYESICSIPEGLEDAVYVIVRRVIDGVTKRYVERFATRKIPNKADGTLDVAQSFFVDCGLSYQGWNQLATTMTLTGGTIWKYPDLLTCTRSVAGFSAGDIGNNIVFVFTDDDGIDHSVRCTITAYTSPTVVTVEAQGVIPESLRGVATARWGKGVDDISGLGHLEGKTVAVLADGNVIADKVVEAGAISLDKPAVVIHVGLPYESDLKTMQINVQGSETLFDKNKIVSSVTMLVDESRGIFAGKDFDNMSEFKQRTDSDGYNTIAPLTGAAKITIANNWKTQGQVCVRQSYPLPLTILGIIPELTPGGKA